MGNMGNMGNMSIRLKETLAKIALLCTTIIWGSSFFIMKIAVDSIAPFYLLAIRFTFAAVLLSLIFIKKLKLIQKDYLFKGCVMGFLLYCAYSFQTIGLSKTTPGKNAFLTTVYCIIVPFLYWLYAGKKPRINHILASIICVIGIGFVSFNERLNIGAGDLLTLISGIFYAMHIVAVSVYSQGRDIFLLTIIQFAFAGFCGWVCGMIWSPFPQSIDINLFLSVIYLCVFATSIALLLQNVGQKYTHASTASIILSLESVFGVLFSILFYHEVLTIKIGFGFLLIFLAVLLSELAVKEKRASKISD